MGKTVNSELVPPWINKAVAYLTLFAFLVVVYLLVFWLAKVVGAI